MPKSKAEKLVEKLSNGVVCFEFRKINGEIRYAAGTNNASCLPQNEVPASNTNSNVGYYDLTKRAWRTCKADSIMRIGSAVNA